MLMLDAETTPGNVMFTDGELSNATDPELVVGDCVVGPNAVVDATNVVVGVVVCDSVV